MSTGNGYHYYLNWAKSRIDEMDAALSSLESKAEKLTTEARKNADRVLADLRGQRDAFQATLREQAAAGEAGWKDATARLETEWSAFQSVLNGHVEEFGAKIEQQRVTFQAQADAQLKIWREAATDLAAAAKTFAAEQKAAVEAAGKGMELAVTDAEERLRTLQQAGNQSWSALSAALSESRAAFDRANKAAQEALRKTAA